MNTVTKNDILILELEGALDSRTSGDFKAWVEEKIIEGYRAIALDCQNLEYISSNGISSILEIKRILAANEGALALVNVAPEVKKLLEFLKILNQVPTYDTIEAVTQFLASYKHTPVATTAIDVPPPSDLEAVVKTSPSDPKASPEGKEQEKEEKQQEPAKTELLTTKLETQEQPFSAAPSGEGISEATATAQLTHCPNCQTLLRVTRPGKYLCPACRYKFQWPN